MQDFPLVTPSSGFDAMSRWRRSMVWLYVSNRLYEWGWIASTRVPLLRRIPHLRPHRGNIIGLTKFDGRRPVAGSPLDDLWSN